VPKVGERALVEAVYNTAMPFKWNATRVQVLPPPDMAQQQGSAANCYNAVPPPQAFSGNAYVM
jgi:hypothetical protein